MPGPRLWYYDFLPGQYETHLWTGAYERVWDPNTGMFLGTDTAVWQYNFTNIPNPFYQVAGETSFRLAFLFSLKRAPKGQKGLKTQDLLTKGIETPWFLAIFIAPGSTTAMLGASAGVDSSGTGPGGLAIEGGRPCHQSRAASVAVRPVTTVAPV